MTVEEINELTKGIVSFDMRPGDTEVYMKYISPLPAGSKVADFGTGQAKSIIRMALCAPQVEIWTWDWGHGNPETIPHSYYKMIHDRIMSFGIKNIYFVIADSDKAWPTWDWPINILNIDASHLYEQTVADINRWEPFVKRGGYIFIHDYNYPGYENYRFEGLRLAVKEYFDNSKYQFLEYLGGTQVIMKL